MKFKTNGNAHTAHKGDTVLFIYLLHILHRWVSSCSVKENRNRSPLYFKLERTGENRLAKKSLIGQVPHAKSCERRFQVFMRNIGL